MKRFLVILLWITVCISLCGCDMWMDGSYYSVTPHHEEYSDKNAESIEATSYNELQEALEDLLDNGRQEGVIYVSEMRTEQLSTFMDLAVHYAMNRYAIGAYAVDAIDYEIGTNAGRTAIAIKISYLHSLSEILRIKRTENMEEAEAVVAEALENCDPTVVVLVKNYESTDMVQVVQDYVDAHPDTCMELPQVTASVYPDGGLERVIEITFTYQTNRDALRNMQDYVEPVFRAAYLNVSGEESESAKFSLMYSFLMERNEYQLETSITPSYSLLRHGVGDSKAFATVYAAMCQGAGLDCQVVTGTRAGEPYVWNIICEDGVYYYVDLLRSSANGRLLRMTQENMQEYVWDYSAFPETGAEYVEPIPEETVPQESSPTQPEETEPEATEESSPETEPSVPDQSENQERTEPWVNM